MSGNRKDRVPMAEQIRLIAECRQSGMTDADRCRENDIAVRTFYNWVNCFREASGYDDSISTASSLPNLKFDKFFLKKYNKVNA